MRRAERIKETMLERKCTNVWPDSLVKCSYFVITV